MQDSTAIREALDAANLKLEQYDNAIQQVKENEDTFNTGQRDVIVTSLTKDRDVVQAEAATLGQQILVAEKLDEFTDVFEGWFSDMEDTFEGTGDTHALVFIARRSPDGLKVESDFSPGARRAGGTANGRSSRITITAGPDHVGEEYTSIYRAAKALAPLTRGGKDKSFSSVDKALTWLNDAGYTIDTK